MTTISNTLSMITCAGSYNSSFFFFFCEASKCITCSSDFETSNSLKILSFKIDFSIIFFWKILRFCKWSMLNNSFAFSIRLINRVCRDKFWLVYPIRDCVSCSLNVHKESIEISYKKIYKKLSYIRFTFIG